MSHTIESIDSELKQLQEKKEQLLKKRSELKELTPAQRLANFLHTKQCHWDHTDQCGWHYSSWDKPCNTRLEYMRKAEAILKEVDIDTIIKILNLL